MGCCQAKTQSAAAPAVGTAVEGGPAADTAGAGGGTASSAKKQRRASAMQRDIDSFMGATSPGSRRGGGASQTPPGTGLGMRMEAASVGSVGGGWDDEWREGEGQSHDDHSFAAVDPAEWRSDKRGGDGGGGSDDDEEEAEGEEEEVVGGGLELSDLSRADDEQKVLAAPAAIEGATTSPLREFGLIFARSARLARNP